MSIIAQKLGRTVYYMLKRKEGFNPDKFYGNKKIENYMRLRPPLILSVPDAVTS